MRPIEQQVILVTGATDGLGRALVGELAARGASVLLHGRDPVKGEATLRDIREETGNERLDLYLADFASLAQVRALAERVLADLERLDVLVNKRRHRHGRRRKHRASGQRGRPRAPLCRELPRAVPAHAPARAAARPVSPCADRQRRLGGPGAARLRRRDARTQLQRRSGVLPKQARALDAHVRPGRFTPGPGRDGQLLASRPYMPTKMVLDAGVSPVDSLDSGVEATLRLVAGPGLDGVSGEYFDRRREARAHPQAYDLDARRMLRELSAELVGLRGDGSGSEATA